MSQRIRITTKADSFEERKRQYRDAGYLIETEQPVPINGLCSFVLVKAPAGADDQ